MSQPTPNQTPRTPTLNYRAQLILSGHKKSISSIKFSPDGNLLASAGVSLLIALSTYLQTVQASCGQVDKNMGRDDWGYYSDTVWTFRGYIRHSVVGAKRLYRISLGRQDGSDLELGCQSSTRIMTHYTVDEPPCL
jgi:WD40 repeat protein